MGTCNLCDEQPDDSEMLDHLRVMHPAEYGDGPERWPDGQVVIVDQTIDSPADLEVDEDGVQGGSDPQG